MKEVEAIEFLRTRIGDEGYIVVGQVPDGTGAMKRRTIDALMVQCWPSRGLSLTAVEYKRTVSDFRRELKMPEKADSIAEYCDFMIILAPKGVVPSGKARVHWHPAQRYISSQEAGSRKPMRLQSASHQGRKP